MHPKFLEILKLSINWDGKVTACCSDYDNELIVGDLSEETMQEVFWGRKMQGIRAILSEDGYDKLPLCRDCYQYIELQT